MKFLWRGYDLTLAVDARRTLLFEHVTDELRFRTVWRPTQQFLNQMSRHRPAQITCFASTPYRFPKQSTGTCVNVYCLNPHRAAVYLGAVFSRQAEADDCAARVAELRREKPDEAQLFLQRGASCIIREPSLCRIPSNFEPLTSEALTAAVRWYFRMFARNLAEASVKWLSETMGSILDSWIRSEAKRTVKSGFRPLSDSPDEMPWGY